MGEDSFHPRLEIIQVAAGDVIAIIDYQKVPWLVPFFSLLDDARILKVLHAGRQDLEIFSCCPGLCRRPSSTRRLRRRWSGTGPRSATPSSCTKSSGSPWRSPRPSPTGRSGL